MDGLGTHDIEHLRRVLYHGDCAHVGAVALEALHNDFTKFFSVLIHLDRQALTVRHVNRKFLGLVAHVSDNKRHFSLIGQPGKFEGPVKTRCRAQRLLTLHLHYGANQGLAGSAVSDYALNRLRTQDRSSCQTKGNRR